MKFVDKSYTYTWIILGSIYFIYGIRVKQQLFSLSVQEGTLLNNWDILLNFLGDVYLNLYVIFPLLLYQSITIIISDFEYVSLIRWGSYRNWVYQTLINFVRILIIMTFLGIGVGLLLTVGVSDFSGWSPFSKINESTQILKKNINMPIVALLIRLFQFTLFMLFIHLFLAFLFVQFKRKGFVIFAGILIWIYGGISFKFFSSSTALFTLPNYLIAGSAGFESMWTPFIILIALLLLIIMILEKIDLNRSTLIKTLIQNWRYVLFLFIIVLALWSGVKDSNLETIWDAFILIFMGSSQEGFSIQAFFSYVFIYLGFVYLMQLFLQRELGEIQYYKLLRYRSINRWFWNWYRRIMLYILLYLIVIMIMAIVLSLLTGSSLDFHISLDASITIYEMLYHFFVNGYLQLLFYTLLAIIVSLLCKETFYSLIVISLLSIFMFPSLNSKLIIPSGLNSMGHVLNQHVTYDISLVLIFWAILGLSIILYIFRKKDLLL